MCTSISFSPRTQGLSIIPCSHRNTSHRSVSIEASYRGSNRRRTMLEHNVERAELLRPGQGLNLLEAEESFRRLASQED